MVSKFGATLILYLIVAYTVFHPAADNAGAILVFMMSALLLAGLIVWVTVMDDSNPPHMEYALILWFVSGFYWVGGIAWIVIIVGFCVTGLIAENLRERYSIVNAKEYSSG
jgi:hypothetical protein